MDAREVQRLLEKILALADSVPLTGEKSAEIILRSPVLSPAAKHKIAALYRLEALARGLRHAQLGSEICEAIEGETLEPSGRSELARFRAAFQAIEQEIERQLGAAPLRGEG